jgi:acylphosphatase
MNKKKVNAKTVEAIVSGKVQGVGFRYFVKTHADSLGVNGYAMNLANGQVQVVMQGEEDDIQSLIKLLEQGTRFASVGSVECLEVQSSEVFGGFGIG